MFKVVIFHGLCLQTARAAVACRAVCYSNYVRLFRFEFRFKFAAVLIIREPRHVKTESYNYKAVSNNQIFQSCKQSYMFSKVSKHVT